MQRDAQSKSTCRQTSEQSAGLYEATRRREFRKKFVPTLPPFRFERNLFYYRRLHLLRQLSPLRLLRLGLFSRRPQFFVLVSTVPDIRLVSLVPQDVLGLRFHL